MEHLRNLELACSSEADELLRERRAMLVDSELSGAELRSRIHARQRPRALRSFDPQRCDGLAATLAAAGTWQVPTLTIVTPRVTRLFARQSWRDTYRYLPDPVARQWTEASLAMQEQQPDADTAAYAEWARGMVARLAGAGVPIMAGTDTPIFFLTPGFSLHQELRLLAQAGLTTAQALEAATLTPARYFHMEHDLGTVEIGKLADLVLLRANPLEDIANTEQIEAVVSDGRLYDRAELDRILAALETTVP